ncbi:hypothetical protein HDV04_003431 [Boothiomyces sp. JEL0838]|nr:hypothetical protein HDV04_003431 [Boothiomyces sp. JEL0838]
MQVIDRLLEYPTYRPEGVINFTNNNWQIPFTAVSTYLAFCYFGKIYMKDRKPFNLKISLALWNSFLAVFSIAGAYITVPVILRNYRSMPFENTVCDRPHDTWASGTVGFWVMLFSLSKIPELIDTVFIVLRKKPLIFLHWYHHATVMMYGWHAYSHLAAAGLYFVAMNYSVHAVMYTYYALQAAGLCPRWFPSYIITISQILQMAVGTYVCVYTWYYMLQGKTCYNDLSGMIYGALMYISYFALFVNFAIQRFVLKKKKTQ